MTEGRKGSVWIEDDSLAYIDEQGEKRSASLNEIESITLKNKKKINELESGGGTSVVTVVDHNTEVEAGLVTLEGGLYVHDDGGDTLISTNPLFNVGAGEAVYMTGLNNSSIYAYYCSTPFDVSTASFASSLDVSSEGGLPAGMAWNNDGSKLYRSGYSSDAIHEYDCSEPFLISTASLSTSLDVSSEDSVPIGMDWNNDGSRLYMVGYGSGTIYQYYCSSGFDISTASLSESLDVSNEESYPSGMEWNNDGSKLYITGFGTDSVHDYDCSTNFDVSTASYSSSFDVSGEEFSPWDVSWNNDGSKLYVIGSFSDEINEYNCSTEFDIQTASHSTSLYVGSEETAPTGMAWSS